MKIEHVLDVIDRTIAWVWICKTYLPDGIICPVCGSTITGEKAVAAFAGLNRTWCTGHGSSFRPMAAIPVLRGTEWQPEEFVKLLLLSSAGKDAAFIGPLLGKSAKCVGTMLDRLAVLDLKSPTGDRLLDG